MVMRSRRPTQWYSAHIDRNALASGAITSHELFGTATVTATAVKGSTVTRFLIDLTVHPQSLTVVVNLFWGLVLLNADAVAAGGLPDPVDTSDRPDYLVRGWLQSGSGNLSDLSQDRRVSLDIRSQRIIRSEEDQLRIVFQASTSGITLDYSFFSRALIKRPA